MEQKKKQYDALLRFFLYIVSPHSQFFFMLISSILVMIMAYGPIKKFHTTEISPQLFPITPQKVREWGGEPTRVTVGLDVRNFPEFDFVKNQFELDGILWFEFDPALISLDTVSKFTFDKANLEKKSTPFTKIVNDRFFARYDVKLKFNMTLNYRFFPFDDHRMFITLINRTVSPSEVMFKSEETDFLFSDEINISGWEIDNKSVKTGYAVDIMETYDPEKTVLYPKTVFSIDFRRVGVRYILLIVLPFFILFFMGLFSFAFDPEKNSYLITYIAIGGITSLLTYRFVLEAMTPKVGYFVLSDYVYSVLLSFSLVEVVVGIITVYTKRLTEPLILLRGILFILFHLVFIFTWYYFLRQLW